MKYSSENLHKLIALTSALEYQLRIAEEIRKEMSKISLKVKRSLKANSK